MKPRHPGHIQRRGKARRVMLRAWRAWRACPSPPRSTSDPIRMIARYAVTLFLAGAVTLGLFYLMQSLISMGSGEIEEGAKGRVIDFIRLRPDTQAELRDAGEGVRRIVHV